MKVTEFRFDDDGDIPNNRLPLILYAGAVDLTVGDTAHAFEMLFEENGWGDGWRNGIYPFHHYHSTAHEVLGIAAGEAAVRMGGEGGKTLTVRAGDAVLIPAGVGHKRISTRGGLLVIGAYPPGASVDLKREREPDGEAIRARIAALPMPAKDPVAGDDGPMQTLWRD